MRICVPATFASALCGKTEGESGVAGGGWDDRSCGPGRAILQNGRADLVALAQEIYNPNWPMDAAHRLGVESDFGSVPPHKPTGRKTCSSITDMMPSAYQVGIDSKG